MGSGASSACAQRWDGTTPGRQHLGAVLNYLLTHLVLFLFYTQVTKWIVKLKYLESSLQKVPQAELSSPGPCLSSVTFSKHTPVIVPLSLSVCFCLETRYWTKQHFGPTQDG